MKKKEKMLTRRIEFEGQSLEVVLRPDADESVMAEIFKWREYQAAEAAIRAARSPILDAGAHIGLFALYARLLNPQVRIFALEPEEENFRLLAGNLSRRAGAKVSIFRAALAGRSGKRSLVVAADSINHHLAREEEGGEGSRQEVSAWALGDFLDKNHIPALGLLKMDIEGGEYEIFEGLSEADYARIENLVLECHACPGRGGREIEAALRERGFGVQNFSSRFEKGPGFIFARNKRRSGESPQTL
jgi:FkbM family methyltransferase